MKQRTLWTGFFALAMAIFLLLGRGTQAQEELQIKIAPHRSSAASHAHDNNITVQALKRGKTEYRLQGKTEDQHTISLTRIQRADVVEGTTVIILSGKDGDSGDLKAHQHRVTITYKPEEEEPSGW